MNDPSLEPTHTAAPAGQAIYDVDVPCPRCEYNLRGLTQPRCPECGQMFDPLEVLAWNKERARQPLPLWWVFGKMLLHPIAFWSMPKVRRSNGLAVRHLLLILAIVGAECGLPMGNRYTAGAIMPTMVFFIVAGLAMWDVHLLLCWLALKSARAKHPFVDAYSLIGYAGVWLIPATIGLVADSVGTHYPSTISLAVLGELVTIASCLLWMVALYAGTIALTRGSHVAAIWCIVTNPFWYIAGMTLSAAVGRP